MVGEELFVSFKSSKTGVQLKYIENIVCWK